MIAYKQDRIAFETRVNGRDISALEEGTLVVSDLLVCNTCAFYVGQWCAEVMDFGNGKEWCFQPYDRCSDYMTEREAVSLLRSMKAEDEEVSWDEERLEWCDI
jgi:hypothetical protein